MKTLELTPLQKKRIISAIDDIVYIHRDVTVSTIFDTYQTHCVRLSRPLTPDEYNRIKSALKPLGLTRFRRVTNRFKNVIICFNATKMN